MTTPLEKKIEKVLVKVYNNGFNARKATDLEPFDMMTVDEAKSAILQLLTETVQEVIGEDEPGGYRRPTGLTTKNMAGDELEIVKVVSYEPETTRNTLRAEQRTNLNRILGGDK